MWPFRKSTASELPRHLQVGAAGEEAACRRLWKNGYRILERNFRCREGEIDIIAEKRRIIYIIEVKTRTGPGDMDGDTEDYDGEQTSESDVAMDDEDSDALSSTADRALEAVDDTRRKRMRRAARVYLKNYNSDEIDVRYKVVAVHLDENLKTVNIKLFEE